MSVKCINPYSGEVIGSYPQIDFSQAQSLVERLKFSQEKWRKLSVSERKNLVHQALSYFEQNREQIAKDISLQMGRPYHQSLGEISGLLARANYMCSIAEQTLTPDRFEDLEGFDRSIQHEPLGVIFVIAAWNYPLLITINSVVPALISGNTVLLKHSSITPEIGRHFARAFGSLGGHNDLLIDLVTDHQTTGKIIEQLPVDHVIFTGSVSGGQQILTHTSKRFMQPGLELGGKDGAYVHSDANIDQAVDTIVDGAMFNSGQSCCGIERAYVHHSVYDQFVEKALKLVNSYKLGDPQDTNTNLGPLATGMKAAKVMEAQVKEAVQKGAKLLAGGEIVQIEKGVFFSATLLLEVTHDMQIMKEENFGPILPIMKVKDMDEAIRYINDSDYGLTSAIFTQDKKVAQDYASKAQAGTIFMNRCDYLDPALPWTGIKNSGVGPSLSKYGFYAVTRRKRLHFKTKI